MVVEPFLVVPVASFHFAVMPRSSRTDRFVCNAKTVEKNIEMMHSLCLFSVAELTAVIRLYCLGSIAKVSNSFLHKIYGRITALLFVCIYETLS